MLNFFRKAGKWRTAHPVVFAILDVPLFAGALLFGLAFALSSSLPAVHHLQPIWLAPIGGALGCLRYLIAGVSLLLKKIPTLRGRVPSFQSTRWLGDVAEVAILAPAAFYFRSSEPVLLQAVSWMAFLIIGLSVIAVLLKATNFALDLYVRRSSQF